MGAVKPSLPSDEISYFLNVAVIGGTLLGLTFIALSFFLVDLLKRYEGTALPVFRSRERKSSALRKMGPPDSLTDQELLDGDPLVVFIAFSTGVAWNLFLFPLTVGLTVAWAGARLGILAFEMCAFFFILVFCFVIRNRKIDELKPYLTRDELLWPYLGGIALVLYAGATGFVLLAALSSVRRLASLAFWSTRWGLSNEHATLAVLKAACIVFLLLGTYTINKDMFIFFKTVAAERMRERWLHAFVRESYPELKKRVEHAIERLPVKSRDRDPLNQIWNHGSPIVMSVHEALKDTDPIYAEKLWHELIKRREGAASWMLDIPSIANWAADVEEALAPHTHADNP